MYTERTIIKDGPEDYEVAAGQTATFRCNAVADSSLNLTIDWLHADQLIDFEQEPRFVQSQDSSLTITKTTELDTGDYTCRARTILDSAEAKATLIVQGKVDVALPITSRSLPPHSVDVSLFFLPLTRL